MGARRALSWLRGMTLVGNRRAVSGLAVPLALAAAGGLLACSTTAPVKEIVSAEPVSRKAGKVTPELVALYEAYRDAQQRGAQFNPENIGVRVVDNRVVIDATAASDGRALEADLVKLGMQQTATFGRVVSGQFPITAIPQLGALDSLAFARAAARTTRSPATPPRP